MKLLIIGFIIGIGKILPGVSGSVLAIRFNIYDKVIFTLSTFFKDIKNNSIFLFKLAFGFLLATIFGSKILYFIFAKYEYFLKIIFVILILTGLPELIKKSKSITSIIIMSIFIYGILTIINNVIYNCNMNYFIAGGIEAFSTIIPGISGTAIYINLGWYDEILQLFGNIYLLEFRKIIPFFLSFVICSCFTVKFIFTFMKRDEKLFYSLISSLLITSVILMFL